MKKLILAVLAMAGTAYAQPTLPNVPGYVVGGYEFNAGPGKGNWDASKNRAEYPTLAECQAALNDAMKDVPQPWPPGIRCAPYHVPALNFQNQISPPKLQ